MEKKIAVIVFNLGGPDKLESVKPFLFNLFNDYNIISLPQPFRYFLAKFISSCRENKAKEIYSKMGGKSPILVNTEEQAISLEKKLNDNTTDTVYKTFIAMRYWHPFAVDVIRNVKEWNPDKIFLLPLYPQYSTATTKSSVEQWEREAIKAQLTTPTYTSCCYPVEDNFISAHVDNICQSLENIKKRTNYPIRILFSAHGLPEVTIKKGDPYRYQIESTAAKIETQIRLKFDDPNLDMIVTFQSRVGLLKWTEPYTDDEIIRAGKDKYALIVCPISFVSDHSETIVELQDEYKCLAEEFNVPDYTVVPVIGTNPSFIESLENEVYRLDKTDSSISSYNGKRFCNPEYNKCPCPNTVI